MNTSTLTGTVDKRPYGVGSKSEHLAVMLDVEPNVSYKLVRKGGNPFSDSSFDGLIGQKIEAEGIINGSQFIITNWTVLAST